MPNCDFYAAGTDHKTVLDYVLGSGDCDVYESYSRFDQSLRQFHSLVDFEEHFSINDWNVGAQQTLSLQLYPRDAGGQVFHEPINLKPEACSGAKIRYHIAGWGLVQLYLEPVLEGRLRASHTNHN